MPTAWEPEHLIRMRKENEIMAHIIILKDAHSKLSEANEALTKAESNITHGDYNSAKLAQVEDAMGTLTGTIETATADIASALTDLEGTM